MWIFQRSNRLHILLCLVYVSRSCALAPDVGKQSRGSPSSVIQFYDVVIVGAGAGGLFASGATQLFGKKAALIERSNHLGGDCTNAACVPSKALRAAADKYGNKKDLASARQYVKDTVNLVRQREDPDGVQERNPNLDVLFVDDCRFVNASSLLVRLRNNTGSVGDKSQGIRILQAKKFILATGASPVVPRKFKDAAERAGIPLLTYRSLLSPEGDVRMWNLEKDLLPWSSLATTNRILVVGGGATGCELGQSIARLVSNSTQVHLVAPHILANEDVILRDSAIRILEASGVTYHRGRLLDIAEDKTCTFDTGSKLLNVDAIILCVGRSPEENLRTLDLDIAGVDWSASGVHVFPSSLQSKTNQRVYAAGDCCSTVPLRSRTATHAAWTAFHAVRNALLKRVLWMGSPSLHPCVPRVVYTEPELACVGLTLEECIQKYGEDGFLRLHVPESGTDRADMERSNRNINVCFVELRAEKITGRILGGSFCGPSAAEMANIIGMTITNRLGVGHIARSVYSYPSYGYLLHRVALSMHLSSVLGLAEVGGPITKLLSKILVWFYTKWRTLKILVKNSISGSSRRKERRIWQAWGSKQAILLPIQMASSRRLVSFAESQRNSTILGLVEQNASKDDLDSFKKWLEEDNSSNLHCDL